EEIEQCDTQRCTDGHGQHRCELQVEGHQQQPAAIKHSPQITERIQQHEEHAEVDAAVLEAVVEFGVIGYEEHEADTARNDREHGECEHQSRKDQQRVCTKEEEHGKGGE